MIRHPHDGLGATDPDRDSDPDPDPDPDPDQATSKPPCEWKRPAGPLSVLHGESAVSTRTKPAASKAASAVATAWYGEGDASRNCRSDVTAAAAWSSAGWGATPEGMLLNGPA